MAGSKDHHARVVARIQRQAGIPQAAGERVEAIQEGGEGEVECG